MSQANPSIDPERLKQALVASLKPLNSLRLDPSQIILGKRIGSGGFADIFHATLKTRESLLNALKRRDSWFRSTRTPVVVKQLRSAGDDYQRLRIVVALARELTVWSRLDHPNLLKLIGFYLDDVEFSYACAVTKLEENGNVIEYLQALNPDQARRLELAWDAACGLAYLHTLRPPVCHGDIKPENTLVTEQGRVLLCDFGLAKTLGNGPSGLTTTSQPFTARYASPEVLQDPATRKLPSDVWSWGCLVYHILFNRLPYHDREALGAIYQAATTGVPPAHVDTLLTSTGVKEVIRSCWALETGARPNMAQCEQAIFGVGPHYDKLSEYFHSGPPVEPAKVSPTYKAEAKGLLAVRNPKKGQHMSLTSLAKILFCPSQQSPDDFLPTAFTPDGKTIVVGHPSVIKFLDTQTMQPQRSITIPPSHVPKQLVYSADGTLLAVQLNVDRLVVYDTKRLQVLWKRDTTGKRMVKIQFCDSDRLLVTFYVEGPDQLVAALDARTWLRLKVRHASGDGIHNTAVSPAHPVMATVFEDHKELCLRHIISGDILQRFPAVGPILFSPNGLAIITGHHERHGQTRVWMFNTAMEMSQGPSYKLSPDGLNGRFVVHGTIWGDVPRHLSQISVSSDSQLACAAVAVSSESSAAQRCEVHLWDLQKGTTLVRFTLDGIVPAWSQIFLRPGSTASSGYLEFLGVMPGFSEGDNSVGLPNQRAYRIGYAASSNHGGSAQFSLVTEVDLIQEIPTDAV